MLCNSEDTVVGAFLAYSPFGSISFLILLGQGGKWTYSGRDTMKTYGTSTPPWQLPETANKKQSLFLPYPRSTKMLCGYGKNSDEHTHYYSEEHTQVWAHGKMQLCGIFSV